MIHKIWIIYETTQNKIIKEDQNTIGISISTIASAEQEFDKAREKGGFTQQSYTKNKLEIDAWEREKIYE